MYAGFDYINTDMCALCIHIINIPCVHGIKVLKDVKFFKNNTKHPGVVTLLGRQLSELDEAL